MQSNIYTSKIIKTKPLKTAQDSTKQSHKGKTWKRENDKRKQAFEAF